ncbi:uncharacterized protein LOC108099158 [Drosophila ficusphila]|uniref:uncharacterized protein LOC108099158 n=1 Tax=Drosophila ficusphila TaxID=30025 RepID=UPI0007E66E11|nr:uncharacterized protein LOC108099158 [Drosophila ficusphila]
MKTFLEFKTIYSLTILKFFLFICMNVKHSGLSDSSAGMFDKYEIDDVKNGNKLFRNNSWRCPDSDYKSADWNDLVKNDPYIDIESGNESLGSVGVASKREYNKLPDTWKERIAHGTKECYYYDTNTEKIYFTLPSKPFIEAHKIGWNGIAAKNCEYKYRCKLRCRHILVKHNELNTPISHVERINTRTKKEAFQKITQTLNIIKSGELEFSDLAKEISDCCSAQYGGDLGPFKPTQMSIDFEQKVVSLKIYKVSDTFETEEGFHILLRTPVNESERRAATRRKKYRRIEKMSDATQNNKCKIHIKKNTLTSSRLLKPKTDRCTLLGQSQRSYGSNSAFSSSNIGFNPSMHLMFRRLEEDRKMRMYTLQQHRIKNTVVQEKMEVANYNNNNNHLNNILKITETVGLESNTVNNISINRIW